MAVVVVAFAVEVAEAFAVTVVVTTGATVVVTAVVVTAEVEDLFSWRAEVERKEVVEEEIGLEVGAEEETPAATEPDVVVTAPEESGAELLQPLRLHIIASIVIAFITLLFLLFLFFIFSLLR